MLENPKPDSHVDSGTIGGNGKKRRACDDLIQELEYLEQDKKKRRVLPRDEPNMEFSLEDPNADFALLMRKHLMSLDNALKRDWVCVCQKCSGLSVKLSLPKRKKDLEAEASFKVFFGVRSFPAPALQEAEITVK